MASVAASRFSKPPAAAPFILPTRSTSPRPLAADLRSYLTPPGHRFVSLLHDEMRQWYALLVLPHKEEIPREFSAPSANQCKMASLQSGVESTARDSRSSS